MYASLLTHSVYKPQIEAGIESYFSVNAGSVTNSTMVWNAHKSVIRGLFVKFGAHEKRRRSEITIQYLNHIKDLERSNKTSPNAQQSKELHQLRLDLSSHLHKNFDFYIKCLRLSWYSQGNGPCKVLANQYKRRVTQSKIS